MSSWDTQQMDGKVVDADSDEGNTIIWLNISFLLKGIPSRQVGSHSRPQPGESTASGGRGAAKVQGISISSYLYPGCSWKWGKTCRCYLVSPREVVGQDAGERSTICFLWCSNSAVCLMAMLWVGKWGVYYEWKVLFQPKLFCGSSRWTTVDSAIEKWYIQWPLGWRGGKLLHVGIVRVEGETKIMDGNWRLKAERSKWGFHHREVLVNPVKCLYCLSGSSQC